MDKYYYMVTQLPMLLFEKSLPMSSEAFLDEAEKWLSKKDYAQLSLAKYTDTESSSKVAKLLNTVRLFESNFRTELAKWRKSVHNGQEFKPESFNAAWIKDNNPLEAEKTLLKFRWDMLSELEQGHDFDIEFLLVYYLKLQILEKIAAFDQEKGLENFQTINKVSV